MAPKIPLIKWQNWYLLPTNMPDVLVNYSHRNFLQSVQHDANEFLSKSTGVSIYGRRSFPKLPKKLAPYLLPVIETF